MKLHELKPQPGSRKGRKRVGRGIAAGQGKTAGRGTKGQKSRAGSGGKLHRQGGNLPFFRRLPFKRGFTNIHRIEWQEVNLNRLGEFAAGSDVTPKTLLEAGLIEDEGRPIVILGTGEVDAALKVKVHRVTQGAKQKLEAAGGTVQLLKE